MRIGNYFIAGLIAVSTTLAARAGLEPDTLPAALAPAVVAPPAPEPRASGKTNVQMVVETPAVVVPAPPPSGRSPFGALAAVGRSDGEVVVGMIALDYNFGWSRPFGERGVISPYGEFVLSYWEGEEGHTGVTSLHEIGASLLLRYRYTRQPLSTFHPYVDGGFGLHYLTEDRIESKQLGRKWQAGSNIGIGLLFPRDERFEVGLRIRHLSNGGTDDFNWGVNQILARFGVRF